MKLVTYATHSHGTFEQLVGGSHDIEVLGFGTPWTGFMDKFKGVREYLDTLPDTEIVIFLDGFDSLIVREDLGDLEETFKSLNCKVLVSHENKSSFSSFLPTFVRTYITMAVFGRCQGDVTANTGLYMGYVRELKQLIDKILQGSSDDDQRNFNQTCQHFSFIRVDTDNIIFENCTNRDDITRSGAYFVQLPGALEPSRILRSVKEYSKYFVFEIILVILVILYFCL